MGCSNFSMNQRNILEFTKMEKIRKIVKQNPVVEELNKFTTTKENII